MNEPELAALLLKDYEAMRAELREYIKRYYSSIAIVQTVIFATVFAAIKENQPGLHLIVPALFLGYSAFMSLITLFISQQASYVKLLENRLNDLCGQPYFIWETLYADQSLRRDKGILFSPLITLIYVFLSVPLLTAFGISAWEGYRYLNCTEWQKWFLVYSAISLFSYILFPITNKIVRKNCQRFNESLMQ